MKILRERKKKVRKEGRRCKEGKWIIKTWRKKNIKFPDKNIQEKTTQDYVYT